MEEAGQGGKDAPGGAGSHDEQTSGGELDLSAVLQSAMELGEQIRQAGERASATEVEGTAGGGLVRIKATGDMKFTAVHISEEAMASGDRELLEDLVLAALRDVVARASELQQDAMGSFDIGELLGSLGAGRSPSDQATAESAENGGDAERDGGPQDA